MKFLNKTILSEKIRESLSSVLPVTATVLILLLTFIPVPAEMLLAFLLGAILLVVGMGLFTLGAETAMSPMGEHMGSAMTKSKKLPLIIIVSFLVGLLVTVSEPDLQVLANQISSIPNYLLIISVGIGVGLFLVVAMLRILLKIKLKYLLLIFYSILFILAIFVPSNFIALSFDSGGVTTGPMTVPFIMSLGVGVAAIRSDDSADNDSFGLVALCSVGPIIAVMMLSLIFNGEAEAFTDYTMPAISDSHELLTLFLEALPHYAKEVAIAVAPMAIFFFVFQFFFGRLPKDNIIKIIIGIAYTYVGLVIFLLGVNVGFMPVGYYIGFEIANSDLSIIIIPLGMVIGYFIVSAEPAVNVLTKQVEETTSGAIPRKVLGTSLSIGVAASVGLAMIRVVTGISIMWFLIPGYVIAISLAFIVPDIFTSIAFDSGGVASGAMTATFLLPFSVGACEAVGGVIVEDAFGVVAMVAMTPLITIQILGLIYKIKQSTLTEVVEETLPENAEEEIITVDAPSEAIIDEDIIDF